MPLEIALLILAGSIPISSFVLKLTLNGVYLTQREFDDFRQEMRARLKELSNEIKRLY